jgi:aspartyl-tRNA(Asn)/glutamyl-tRNA(Gln) amidotransferase subunit A
MQGTTTTAGSKILADWQPDGDATVVAKLKAAGAVIVGKTRLSEYAYSPGSNNVHYGTTRNPWNLDHDTGGSSSGSAAAVAAGIVYAALGSDTGGSIRIPASQCGLVGLKPTYGRTSLFGAVSLAWSLDHAGPLARSVRDVAVVMDAIQGHDPRDLRSRAAPAPASLVDALAADRADRLRIGVPLNIEAGAVHCTPASLAAWREGLRVLEHHGCHLVELDVPELDDLRLVNSVVLVLEAAAFHHRQLAQRFNDYGTFFRRRVLRAFAFASDAYIQAQQVRAALRARLDTLFEHVHLVSTPSMPAGAPLLGTPAATTFTAPFNLLGWPAASVPVGQTHEGLPLGLQLVGRSWDDGTVLRIAQILEHYGPWFQRA